MPCLVGVLIGGILGSFLARGDGSPALRYSSVSVAIPDMSAKQATSPETVPEMGAEMASEAGLTPGGGNVDPETAGLSEETVGRAESLAGVAVAARIPAAAEIGEAEEAVLARLYEEPMAPVELDVGLAVEPGEAAAPDPVEPRTSGAARMQLPAILPPDPAATEPAAWERYAVPLIGAGRRPMIAIVLDDLGLNRPGAWRAIALPSPLTLSFMTYAEGLERLADRARGAGHELLVHVPMEPSSAASNPGPNVLLTDLPADEVARRLDWALGRFEGFVGINNHMGSKFTSSLRAMATVMAELKARGLLFLDSRTASASVGTALAAQLGVPYAERDVFLDNEWRDGTAIRRQLERLEARARHQGYAVGIGHPHRVTLEVLAQWLPEVRGRGFDLVPVSAIVRHRMGWTQQFAENPG
ncbi:MAG: divergent polysaccharide deacetylase family protein [Kiloniellales bacterium]